MAYATLTAGEGLLQKRTELDADAKSSAESVATLFVDSTFAAWDRSTWVGAAVPQEIGLIARDLSTFEYLRLVYGGKPPERFRSLKEDAERRAEQVISAGGPLLTDGTRQAQKTTEAPAVSRSFEVRNA